MFLDALEERLRRRRRAARVRRPARGQRPRGAGERARVVPATELPAATPREASCSTTGASPEHRSRRRPSPRTRCSSARSARRRGTRSSSPARRSATSSRSSSPRWSSRAPGSPCAEPCSRASRSSSSAAAPTSRGARRRRRRTTSTSSSRRSATTIVHYLYRGQCEPMRRFFAGTLKAQGQPDQEISYYETAHGPVVGYATVGGKRVAISVQRSTRGRELLSTRAFYDLNTGSRRLGEGLPLDDERRRVQLQLVLRGRSRHRALLERAAPDSCRRNRSRAADASATGDYDWRGFVPFAGHAQGINPPSGAILNWNNKPAANVGAADSNFAYGSVHRSRSPAARGRRAQEAHARDAHGRDEQGRDAGSARRSRVAGHPCRAPDRPGAERARGGGGRRSSTAGARAGRAGSTASSTGRSTIRARR